MINIAPLLAGVVLLYYTFYALQVISIGNCTRGKFSVVASLLDEAENE